MTRTCYHCHQNEAMPRSNFCSECNKGMRFDYQPEEPRMSWTTRLLYLGAFASVGWLIYETVKFILTH